ncbi:carbohydrate ABC transporter permease [Enterococcus casseliflavus]|uniref:carbohydrate ABC transporter permease n=1 Tax=Enterococcus casseliflavus TaxID=37734 RepID=UPI0012E29263|nr:carbohydrate ABC transporter permease [Enterococcus casseliflavus]MUN74208.1 ABC transporter permease subunit [Enterococcus casseliflavus]MUN97159.1 ABC transporter permease subunit [Enterococcus casseliflavus]
MSKEKKVNRLFTYLLLVLGALIFLMPYFYMLVASTQSNTEIVGGGVNFRFGDQLIKNWQALMARYNYPLVLWNSLVIAVLSTVLATVSATMAGYALAKYKFRGSSWLFNIVMLSRMVPFFATLIPLFYLMSRMGLANTYAGIVIPSIASTTSVFMMRQYSHQFPTSLMEAARMDGASEWIIFSKIAVPVLRPTIITTGLLIFMGSWNQYLFPLVMLSETDKFTIPLVIRNLSISSTGEVINYGALMLVLATSVIPMVLIYAWAQAKFKENDIGTANK